MNLLEQAIATVMSMLIFNFLQKCTYELIITMSMKFTLILRCCITSASL